MTRYDKILIIFVIIFSLGSILFSKLYIGESLSKTVYITVDGEKYKEIIINENTDKKIDIVTDYGRNLVLIKDGKVRVLEASCPDKLDIKQGSISAPGEMIVCLPNKLTIEIMGDRKEMEDSIDYISH